MKLHGNGSYALSAVKEMRISDDFLSLGQDFTNCQVQEAYEDCTTRIYYAEMIKQCNCVPYSLRLGKNQVYLYYMRLNGTMSTSTDISVSMFK